MLYDNVTRAFHDAEIQDILPHDFRHTFASRALRADPNLKKLQETMDHSSLTSTLRYVHVLQGEAKRMRAGVAVTKTLPDNVHELRRKQNVPE